MQKVIVTGVSGQVGSYMADFLLEKGGFEVYGAIRRLSVPNHKNIEHILNHPNFKLIEMDLSDEHSINACIEEIRPDYFINFAANSFVGLSWKMPMNHMQSNAIAVMHQLESIRKHCPKCRYYNAGSSEEFGDVVFSPQTISHPLRPRSPYGASKASARHIVKVWRDSYDLYAVQGFLFNHESERRGEEFVTRKITKAVARIKKELKTKVLPTPVELGNLDAQRDWSHAEDFVQGVWMMLNQEYYLNEKVSKQYNGCAGVTVSEDWAPKDYLLASGETHNIRAFVNLAFEAAGIKGVWCNSGLNEEFVLSEDGSVATKKRVPLVVINPEFYRPAEVELLLGDPSGIQNDLGWELKVDFRELVRRMVENDIKEANSA